MKKSVESGKEIDMKCVRNLLEKLDYKLLQGNLDQEISSLVYDSRKVEKDAMFVCVKGAAVDGHAFAKEVVEKGASVLVVSEDVEVGADVTVIKVADTREALAYLAAAYFDTRQTP